MGNIKEVQHDLRRDIHNIMNLLKFIQEENLTSDNELSSMLKMCLEREKQTISNLDQLTSFISIKKGAL